MAMRMREMQNDADILVDRPTQLIHIGISTKDIAGQSAMDICAAMCNTNFGAWPSLVGIVW